MSTFDINLTDFDAETGFNISLHKTQGPVNVDTIFGVAKVDLKTVNGITIANVKTWSGIT